MAVNCYSIAVWLVMLGAIGSSEVRGEEATGEVAIGASVRGWTDLPGVDGKSHSLTDLAKAKAVAVVFFANHCPDCKIYLPRVMELSKEYKEKGVEFVLLSVSTIAEDDLEHMRATAKEKGISFAYLLDKSQKTGRAFGARTTPELFLLDGERRLAYRGAIDDHWKPEKVQARYAKNAIEAVLAGRAAEPAVTEAEGCSIEYEDE